jgi:excisionase family DNA binding protein
MFMTTNAVALFLDVTRQTVRQMILDGRLPAIRLRRRGHYKISLYALKKFLETQEKQQAEKVELLRLKRRMKKQTG